MPTGGRVFAGACSHYHGDLVLRGGLPLCPEGCISVLGSVVPAGGGVGVRNSLGVGPLPGGDGGVAPEVGGWPRARTDFSHCPAAERSMSPSSRVVDLLAADDPRDLLLQVVQRLVEGEVVGLPTETQYVAAAYSLSPAVTPLAAMSRDWSGRAPVLAVKSTAEALDYVPRVTELGQKLLRRFWPGPVTLEFAAPQVGGLARSLPPATAEAGGFEESLAIRCPAHEVLQAVLRMLPAPLLVSAERDECEAGRSALELATRGGSGLSLVVDAGPLRYQQPTSVVRVHAGGWEIPRERVVTARTLNRLAGHFYLFVCTGNTCRSPMAEALFRRRLAERLGCPEDELVDRGYSVASAGVAAGPGEPASEESVEQMRQRGIDLRHHESQPVTEALVYKADRILTMTRGHREVLVREFPDLAERIEVLAADGRDLSDPIGGGPEEYRVCCEQIEQGLTRLLAQIPPV